MSALREDGKSAAAFRTISEVSRELDIPQHVLRFWETKFSQIKPLKRGGGRRYYRPEDIELLRRIRDLLHGDGYTIKGVQKLLKEGGVTAVVQREARGAGTAARPSGMDRESRERLGEILKEMRSLRALIRDAQETMQ